MGEMASSTSVPAALPEKGGSPPGEGLEGGLFSVRDWEEFRARSKRIIHRAANQGRCLALARSRAEKIPSVPAGQSIPNIDGEVSIRSRKAKISTDLSTSVSMEGTIPTSAGVYVWPTHLVVSTNCLGIRERDQGERL